MCYPPGGKGCKACYNGQTVKRDKLCFSPIIVMGYIHTSVVLSPLTTVTPDPQGDPVAFEEDTSRQISPQGEDLVAGIPGLNSGGRIQDLWSANTRPLPNAGFILAQRRRRWASINPTLVRDLVLLSVTRPREYCIVGRCWFDADWAFLTAMLAQH